MGYTIHWSFKPAPRGKAKQAEELYQRAIKDCSVFLYRYNMRFERGDDRRLSGYSAHCKPGSYGGIKFNGTDSESCEDFIFREHLSQNEPTFCKTDRRSYTVPALVCLYLMKRRLGELIHIETNGRDSELFAEARKIMLQLCGFKRYTEIEPLTKEIKCENNI